MGTVCRLCAKKKPLNELTNSIEDQNIQQKLINCARWDSIVVIEYETLPKKICNLCYTKLEMSWSFAESVAQAQHQIFSMLEESSLCSFEDVHDSNIIVKDEPMEIIEIYELDAAEPADNFSKPFEPMVSGHQYNSLNHGFSNVGASGAASNYGPTHDSNRVQAENSKSKEKYKNRVTGYIVYSKEMRAVRCSTNPNCSFGGISRMIGNEWRNMSAQDKQYWEEKASKLNEEKAIKYAEEHGLSSPALQPELFQSFLTADPLPNQVFECCWDKCDYQFEDPIDCVEHCISQSQGHVKHEDPPRNGITGVTDYTCKWRNCIRQTKRNIIPFTRLPQLLKHVRLVHIMKCGKLVPPQYRSK